MTTIKVHAETKKTALIDCTALQGIRILHAKADCLNRVTEFLLNFAIGKLCSDTESRCLIPYGLFAFGIRKSSAFKDLFNK